MNVTGVAAATVISTALSAGAVLFLLVRESSYLRPEFSCPDKENVREIVRIGLPAALQGAVFCFANIFIQAAVNSFGADAAAGSAVAMTFEYFAYYAIISLSGSDHIYQPELCRTQLFPLQKKLLLSAPLCHSSPAQPLPSLKHFRKICKAFLAYPIVFIGCTITDMQIIGSIAEFIHTKLTVVMVCL